MAIKITENQTEFDNEVLALELVIENGYYLSKWSCGAETIDKKRKRLVVNDGSLQPIRGPLVPWWNSSNISGTEFHNTGGVISMHVADMDKVPTRDDINEIVKGVSHSLYAAHRAGIVHCDIRKENIRYISPNLIIICCFTLLIVFSKYAFVRYFPNIG